MSSKKSKGLPVGKLIALVIIVLVVVAMTNPKLLFFLNSEQQKVIADFQRIYFSSNNPLQSSGEGFDSLRLVSVVLLLCECWAVSFVVNIFEAKVKLKSRHAETIKSLVCNCIKYFIVIYAIVFGLSIMGVNMIAVIASLGVLSLIVGFGAQTLIEDVITGLFLIFEGQFRVGDIVSIDNFRGTVTSIGIRTTRITDSGGNIKIINNSDIRTITNLSEVESTAVSVISIAYSASIEEAEKVIEETIEKLPEMHRGYLRESPSMWELRSLEPHRWTLRSWPMSARPISTVQGVS